MIEEARKERERETEGRGEFCKRNQGQVEKARKGVWNG